MKSVAAYNIITGRALSKTCRFIIILSSFLLISPRFVLKNVFKRTIKIYRYMYIHIHIVSVFQNIHTENDIHRYKIM